MALAKLLKILCLMTFFIAGGCAGLDRDPASQYSGEQLQLMGQKFLAAGDLGQALKFLTLAEKKRPRDPTIHYDLGLAFGARGLPINAQMHFEKALSLKPDYPEANNALGAFFADRGQLDKAEENFQKALANPLYQTPYFALFNLGRIYERKGDLEAALKYYQEAVRMQPNYGIAYFRMGQVLEALRRGAEAREAYGKAVEYSPVMVEAHLFFGIMSYTAGDLERALYSLSKVIKLAPNSNMALEAKRYLERLQGIVPETHVKSSQPTSDRMSQLEVVSDKENLQKEQNNSSTPPLLLPSASSKNAPSETQWTYVIQIASFLDRENAETLKKRLSSKGYEVVLKPFVHQTLGPVYIVQLKPVSDPAKANTMMADIENEERIKPIILKVPANL